MYYSNKKITRNILIDALQPEIKPLREYKRGELAKEVFKCVALCGMVGTIIVLPGSAQILKIFEVEDTQEKRKVRKALKNLVDSGTVIKKKKKGSYVYELSAKGKQKAEYISIESLKFPVHTTWDGYWRLILFDIPNTKKKHRDIFSFKLRDLGCKQFQKSIYAYPFACKKEIDVLTDFYSVSKHTQYLVVQDTDYFSQFKKYFVLKNTKKQTGPKT